MRNELSPKLLIGALLLCLSACATSPGKGARPESDLDVLALGVQAMLPSRSPAGDVRRAEDAQTTEQAWNLLLDLEDLDYLHHQDKARALSFVEKAVTRIKEARQPCGFWAKILNRGTCR